MEPYRQRTNHFHIPWHAFSKTGNPRPRGRVLGVLTVSNILFPHLWAPHSYHIANALTFRPPHLRILLNANSWHTFYERGNPRPRGRVLGVLTVSKFLSPHLWAPHSYHITNALTFGTCGSKDTTECKFLTHILWEKDSSVPRTSTSSAYDVNDSITLPVGTPKWPHCKLPDARNLTI
jgi:hypothetical protein